MKDSKWQLQIKVPLVSFVFASWTLNLEICLQNSSTSFRGCCVKPFWKRICRIDLSAVWGSLEKILFNRLCLLSFRYFTIILSAYVTKLIFWSKCLSSSAIKRIEARTNEVISLNVGKPKSSKDFNVWSIIKPQWFSSIYSEPLCKTSLFDDVILLSAWKWVSLFLQHTNRSTRASSVDCIL